VRQDGAVSEQLVPRQPIGAEFVLRLRLLLWSVAAVAMAAGCLVLLVLTVAGLVLTIVWVGVPILFAVVLVTRPIANVHRRFAGWLLGRPIGSPYLEPSGGNLLVRLRALAADPGTWRDLAWLAVNATAGLAISLVGLVEGVLDLLFWWLPRGVMAHTHAYVCRALLAPTERTALAQRVQQLARSRAETVDTSAAELRRIERDLHDGAQARLVSLGMSLGMAEEQIARDPEGARLLLAEARESSSQALAELRDLVRGIHPPVLADRGLVGAVRALALAAPRPVALQLEVPERLPAPVESAAYFALAEGLTNAIKHGGGQEVAISVWHDAGRLEMLVRDGGPGGAEPERGTGLRGIERRLSAFDGTLELDSPAGGPTCLRMTLPCEPPTPA
jgi:signal transduction histidine kinase